jgi:hypothetical protein
MSLLSRYQKVVTKFFQLAREKDELIPIEKLTCSMSCS